MELFKIVKSFKPAFESLKKDYAGFASVTVLGYGLIFCFSLFFVSPQVSDFGRLGPAVSEVVLNDSIYFSYFGNLIMQEFWVPLIICLFSFCMLSAFYPVYEGSKVSLKNFIPPKNAFINFIVFLVVFGGIFCFLSILPLTVSSYYILLSQKIDRINVSMIFRICGLAKVLYLFIFLRYSFAAVGFLKGLSFEEALRKSASLVDGNYFRVVFFVVLLTALNTAGYYTYIGWIITVPLSIMAFIYAYDMLENDEKNKQRKNI